MTWNQFDPEVSAMRTRLSERWNRLGKDSACPTLHLTSFKQQALIELARRLEVERRLADASADQATLADLLDAAQEGQWDEVKRLLTRKLPAPPVSKPKQNRFVLLSELAVDDQFECALYPYPGKVLALSRNDFVWVRFSNGTEARLPGAHSVRRSDAAPV